MKLKREVLRARCKRQSLQDVKYLNISKLGLVQLDKLDPCENLSWLVASQNKLQGDEGLENLKQLWNLDLSNNFIANIQVLSRYLALGTVILTNNNLKWIDLERIKHAHFLSISLHGNPALDSDPYYRIHVIDCLPLIWELDGRLVTVTERLHVKQFFIDTEFTAHPVRHKTGRTFRTTAIRNIGTDGIVSKQCKYIYSKFPMSETHTKHTDERRLRYLCHMVQEDILRWFAETQRKRPIGLTDTFLDDFLEFRKGDEERCNMVLLLLVISLEFQMPTALMKAVLASVGLDLIGKVSTMPIFLLPICLRTKVICILLNAAKVDRDNYANKDNGLYPQLFMCLYYSVARLTHINQSSEENMHRVKPLPSNADYMALLTSEAVSLMLQVPRFYKPFLENEGVMQLVAASVGGDYEIVRQAQIKLIEADQHPYLGHTQSTHKNKVSQHTEGTKTWTLVKDEHPRNMTHKMVSDMILTAITKRLDSVAGKMENIPIGDRYLSMSDSLPIKPLHSVIWASQFLTKGETIPNLEPPILNPVREAAKPKRIQPKMGDKVLLGPQVVGELASLLEGGIAMVKIDAIPISNGAVESKLKSSDAHFAYVDLEALCYARDIGMWRPAQTVGDKYTIHSVDKSQTVSFKTDGQEKEPFPQEHFLKAAASKSLGNFGMTSNMMLRSRSVGTGFLTGYRYTLDEIGSGVFSHLANNPPTESVKVKKISGQESATSNRPRNANLSPQGLNIFSAEPKSLSSVDLILNVSSNKDMNMDALHLHDNVHHIRGLTPRDDSVRSDVRTYTPSTARSSSKTLGENYAKEQDNSKEEVMEDVEEDESQPDISRSNTPTLEAKVQSNKRNKEVPLFSFANRRKFVHNTEANPPHHVTLK